MRARLLSILRGPAAWPRFLLVGSFNTVLDVAIFFILANGLGLYPVAANVLSTSLTMMVSFQLNHHFVFGSAKAKRQTAPRFIAVTLFNVWLVQSTVIFLFIHATNGNLFLQQHLWTRNLLAKAVAIGLSFGLNFIMYRAIFHGFKADQDASA